MPQVTSGFDNCTVLSLCYFTNTEEPGLQGPLGQTRQTRPPCNRYRPAKPSSSNIPGSLSRFNTQHFAHRAPSSVLLSCRVLFFFVFPHLFATPVPNNSTGAASFLVIVWRLSHLQSTPRSASHRAARRITAAIRSLGAASDRTTNNKHQHQQPSKVDIASHQGDRAFKAVLEPHINPQPPHVDKPSPGRRQRVSRLTPLLATDGAPFSLSHSRHRATTAEINVVSCIDFEPFRRPSLLFLLLLLLLLPFFPLSHIGAGWSVWS